MAKKIAPNRIDLNMIKRLHNEGNDAEEISNVLMIEEESVRKHCCHFDGVEYKEPADTDTDTDLTDLDQEQ